MTIVSRLRTRQFYYQIFDRGESGIVVPGWLMSYHRGPLEPGEVRMLKEGATPERIQARVLPMTVPDEALMQEAERKRMKRGILGGKAERAEFAKTLYLPYLDFTYQHAAHKGLFSKQTVLNRGRSAILAIREVNLGFEPNLVEVAEELVELELPSDAVVPGVDSTTLVQERLDELRRLLSDYDRQLEELEGRKEASKVEAKESGLRDHIEHLEKTVLHAGRCLLTGLSFPRKQTPTA